MGKEQLKALLEYTISQFLDFKTLLENDESKLEVTFKTDGTIVFIQKIEVQSIGEYIATGDIRKVVNELSDLVIERE